MRQQSEAQTHGDIRPEPSAVGASSKQTYSRECRGTKCVDAPWPTTGCGKSEIARCQRDAASSKPHYKSRKRSSKDQSGKNSHTNVHYHREGAALNRQDRRNQYRKENVIPELVKEAPQRTVGT